MLLRCQTPIFRPDILGGCLVSAICIGFGVQVLAWGIVFERVPVNSNCRLLLQVLVDVDALVEAAISLPVRSHGHLIPRIVFSTP
jgi:hypothetical protein